MAEKANSTTENAPSDQCFLAAAKKNRLLRISAHVLNFISLSLFIAGMRSSGLVRELLVIAAVGLWFIACHVLDAAINNSPD